MFGRGWKGEKKPPFYKVEWIVCFMTTHRHTIQYMGASKMSLCANQNTVLLMNIHVAIIIRGMT